jgi:hypothetical protein
VRDVAAQSGRSLRIVIDTTYVHFGFLKFLERAGVPFNVVAYHYYYHLKASPYSINDNHGKNVDILAAMAERKRPVVVNEFNAAEVYDPLHGKPFDEEAALQSLKTHIEYIKGQREANIEGVQYYELFDEPWLGVSESIFGLMKDPSTPKVALFLATAYACGPLNDDEQATLISHSLFTRATLDALRASCVPRNRSVAR